jgi:hypothetical protein
LSFIIFDIHRGTMNAPDKDDDAADAWIKGAEILIKEGATTLSIAHSPYSDDARARGSSHQWRSWDGRLHSEGDKEKRTSVLASRIMSPAVNSGSRSTSKKSRNIRASFRLSRVSMEP